MELNHVPLQPIIMGASVTENNADEGRILCCECGTLIEPNPTGTCAACLRTRVDIGGDIPKQAALYFCKSCERYLQPPDTWVRCALETRQLLALCLKRLRGLSAVRLVDASFVWTEPHSKRIKVRITIQKEVQAGAVLQQSFIVEYVVNGQMCGDCHRTEAKDFWKALVQLRMKSKNKKTLYYLEQLVLRQRMHENTTNIKQAHDGLDFMFLSEAQARKFVNFVESSVPCRVQQSKKLISHDAHSNIYNYKFTLAVEIVPVCKDTAVCLPKKLSQHLGGIGQLCVVLKVTNVITLVDPSTAQRAELHSAQYWRQPFSALCTSRQLIEYTVMDVEQSSSSSSVSAGQKSRVTDVWLTRSSMLGHQEAPLVHARTHLGMSGGLVVGDALLCVDLAASNVNDANLELINADKLPDVLPVKRVFGDSSTRRRRRRWKLKRLRAGDDEDTATMTSDGDHFTEFLEDLEEDVQLRQNVNIYRDTSKPLSSVDTNALNLPEVGLEEMMDDLNID